MNYHSEMTTDNRILAFHITFPVRWADMDVNAHVNNVRFFEYFESARLAWFEGVRKRSERNGLGPVVAQAACSYKRSIPYPETLRVNLYAGVPGRSSFTTYYELVSEADHSIKYADGQAIMVWVDRATAKSQPLPDYVKAVLAPAPQEA